MDRFVLREPRPGADYSQGNQMMQFPAYPESNRTMIPETMYFGGYRAEFSSDRNPGYIAVTHVNAPHFAPSLPVPNQAISGVDPRYLAVYADNNANFIAGNMAGQRQQMERDQTPTAANGSAFGGPYQNRNFAGVDRNKPNTFTAQMTANSNVTTTSPRQNPSTSPAQIKRTPQYRSDYYQQRNTNTPTTAPTATKLPAKEDEEKKKTVQFPVTMKTRTEILNNLHKTGARAFSGPVEKVLKWHKALQELGLLVLYETVAKCVSVRSGESCAKTLVVRDDSGPAMQVVYYEIDFLLPELKPPCTVRVIGRMMPGTCRLQAFSVRPATGDDVSTLQRRAAVAAHHVSKLCKEFGHQS